MNREKNPLTCGQRFGRLTVIARAGRRSKATIYLCRCDCGKEHTPTKGNLLLGHTTSCGCYKVEKHYKHGKCDTKVYKVWAHMVERCTDSDHPCWEHYGGRGIQVCARWMDFRNFYADMGDPPPGLSLDRIDNNGNYTPGNCRWATQRQQVQNRRSKAQIDKLRADIARLNQQKAQAV